MCVLIRVLGAQELQKFLHQKFTLYGTLTKTIPGLYLNNGISSDEVNRD